RCTPVSASIPKQRCTGCSSCTPGATWVLIPEKGAIAFMANSEIAEAHTLDRFSNTFVRSLSSTHYGKSIGAALRYTIPETIKISANYEFQGMILDFAFHGDPAIKLYSHSQPDFLVEQASISTNPEFITTEFDSFAVNVVVRNLGRAAFDSCTATLTHYLPNGMNITYTKKIGQVFYIDTIVFNVGIKSLPSAGLNSLRFTIDSENAIPELDETNNSTQINFMIKSVEVIPVIPYKYSIIPINNPEFFASTADPFSGSGRMIFELDTTPLYNSTLKYTSLIRHEGGIINFKPPITCLPNTVYFWRIGTLFNNDELKWNESSFIHIQDKQGWSQAHFHQFTENDYTYIVPDATKRSFSFINTPKRLMCRTVGLANNDIDFSKIETRMDATMVAWSSCGPWGAINVMVFDSITLLPWASDKAAYGHRNYPDCKNSNNKYFSFTSYDPAARNGMKRMLIDSIPSGNYILIQSFISGNFDTWEDDVLAAFELLGAKKIRSIPKNFPYIFFVKKGQPQTAKELVGTHDRDIITLYVELPANYIEGSIESTLIGPAKNRNTLQWDEVQLNAEDESWITLKGVTAGGTEHIVQNNVQQKTIENLNTYINPQKYPYMKIGYNTRDTYRKTPAQLRKMQVYYDLPAEIAISAENHSFYNDTLQEGDNLKLNITAENISIIDFDSLYVSYTVKNSKNEIIYFEIKYLSPLKARTAFTDNFTFSTQGLSGRYSVITEFNPINPKTGNYFEIEQYHFNNIAQHFFYVQRDKRNPLLDVTFDGVRILIGVIVSAINILP
ncbi:MAG: C25 family cysteine peptidase, partial [Bacteroidales bacterium]